MCGTAEQFRALFYIGRNTAPFHVIILFPYIYLVWGVPRVPQFRASEKLLRRNNFSLFMCGTYGKKRSAMYRTCGTSQGLTVKSRGIIVHGHGQHNTFRSDAANPLALGVLSSRGFNQQI